MNGMFGVTVNVLQRKCLNYIDIILLVLQMEVCWRRQADRQHTLKKLFQYKVHDKGASFFARGTSSAVL